MQDKNLIDKNETVNLIDKHCNRLLREYYCKGHTENQKNYLWGGIEALTNISYFIDKGKMKDEL